jgi:hypothetical protein
VPLATDPSRHTASSPTLLDLPTAQHVYNSLTEHTLLKRALMQFGITQHVPSATCMRPDILTAMSIKITVHWDVTQCSLVHKYKYFRNCLHLQSTNKHWVNRLSETLASVYQTTWCHITEIHDFNTVTVYDLNCYSSSLLNEQVINWHYLLKRTKNYLFMHTQHM